jgi:hypothetical protein
MKKSIIVAIAVMLMGCGQISSKFGQGGKNAAQFVKEQVPQLKEDIESFETIAEDSLLTDRMLSLGSVQQARTNAEFWEGKISRDQYQQFIDSTSNVLQDVQYSWQFSNVVNDSLKKLTKYQYNWAKVYTVRVKMKSGVEKDVRVLMDQDGITPRMTEKQFGEELQEYTDKMIQAQRDIYNKN